MPLLAPIFTKLQQNLGEMECWYDQWLKALGCAVIVGPTDCAGQIVDLAVADMSPPKRRACGQLNSKMTVLCDGSVVTCDQDVLGIHAVGRIGETSIAELWQKQLGGARAHHANENWNALPLCGGCREWHRP